MSSAGTQVFSTGGTRALRWAGATKNDIITQNPGKNGANVIKAIEKLEAEAERKVCERCFGPMLCSFEAY